MTNATRLGAAISANVDLTSSHGSASARTSSLSVSAADVKMIEELAQGSGLGAVAAAEHVCCGSSPLHYRK